jgi:hypothetical protein
MNNLINLDYIQETDYLFTIFSFIICLICSFILKKIYEVSSSTLTGKSQISNIIPLLSSTTFLVILIVKSSLALSLGLVGALSIVRFRTPIKEPEELVYLFISIAIGLGFGSGQITITSTIFLLIIAVIFFFYRNKIYNNNNDYNLLIEIDKHDNVETDDVLDALKKDVNNFDLIKYEISEENITIMFKLNVINIEIIDNTRKNILKSFPKSKVSFYEAKQLY